MPVDTDQIIEVLSTIAKNEQMKVTAEQAVRAGIITAAATTLGALAGGPLGAVAGSIFGGGIAYATSTDFVSVVEILAKMDSSKKECVAEEVRKIMKEVAVADIGALIALMCNSSSVKQDVKNALTNFLKNKMQLEVMYG